jgi:hypothetical protein
MEDVEPPADLVHAGFSLFFCQFERFAEAWTNVRGRFEPGSVRRADPWEPTRGPATADDLLRQAGARALFDGLEVERFDEEENDGEACSGPKHWHVSPWSPDIQSLEPA